ncbi:MAG: SDR family oxidoreductase [Myxococcales bacterium]|nr:SDR family oxidoreductase [Myxococcales bacterium]
MSEATDRPLEGKRCVVTGATSGIGRATAVALAGAGARVAIVCRDPLRGEETVAEIHERTGSDAVELFQADFASQAAIRQLGRELLTRCPRIDVLVNNAGVVDWSRRETVDGIEQTWAVNHLAFFLLTNLLLERIRESAPARIVNVASDAHRFVSRFDPDVSEEGRFRWWQVYGRSKLANVLFTRELSRRLAGSGVTVNAVHPGAVSTRLGQQNGWWAKPLTAALGIFFKTPEQGAASSVHLATAPELAEVSGRYFADCREKDVSALARDDALAARLWTASERQVGLQSS